MTDSGFAAWQDPQWVPLLERQLPVDPSVMLRAGWPGKTGPKPYTSMLDLVIHDCCCECIKHP